MIATKMTTAANAVLLQYTAPIYVALLDAWFLEEQTEWFDWTIILVVIGGMILFFLDGLTSGSIMGNICAILRNLLTGLIGLLFMFESMPDVRSWFGLIFLGVVQLGLSYVLYSEAIKHISAIEAILIPGIEPILNPIWVFLILGETPGKWALVGGLIVLISVTIRCVIAAMPSLIAGKGTG